MIGYLRGKVHSLSQEQAIVDVGGVGYELSCSTFTLEEMAGRDEVQVLVYTHVREDALQLYGFANQREKFVFLELLKVNGVGPKLALKILSGVRVPELIQMVARADIKGLSGIPKVGKKTAEQIVLSLKGKIEVGEGELALSATADGTRAGVQLTDGKRDLVSALVNLGYRLNEVEKVVGEMPSDVTLQDGLRRGLAALSGHLTV